MGVQLQEEVIWAIKPRKYVEASTYAAYGNDPFTEVCYVAGALFVVFPAVGGGIRATVDTI